MKDDQFKEWCRRCGISCCEKDGKKMGNLGDFVFRPSHNYYVIVEGKVPLSVALKLYGDVVGKTDIRVNGNCGCPPPIGNQINWYDQKGCELIPRDEWDKVKLFVERGTLNQYHLDSCKPIENVPKDKQSGYIELYHIDSELGLYIFVQHIKRYLQELVGIKITKRLFEIMKVEPKDWE